VTQEKMIPLWGREQEGPALLEKFNFSGLERDENYHRIAEKRLKGDPQDTLS